MRSLSAFRAGEAAIQRIFRSLHARFKGLRSDETGVGAVEFALLFPLLLIVYLVCFELTVGFSVAKRATSSASTVADLVTQQATMSKASLGTMSDVAKAIFVPYPTTGFQLKISGIKVDTTGTAKIAWSWKNDGTRPYTNGAIVTLPTTMATPDTFLVRSELSIPHDLVMYFPNFSGSEIRTLTISREYYYRQRLGNDIACTDC